MQNDPSPTPRLPRRQEPSAAVRYANPRYSAPGHPGYDECGARTFAAASARLRHDGETANPADWPESALRAERAHASLVVPAGRVNLSILTILGAICIPYACHMLSGSRESPLTFGFATILRHPPIPTETLPGHDSRPGRHRRLNAKASNKTVDHAANEVGVPGGEAARGVGRQRRRGRRNSVPEEVLQHGAQGARRRTQGRPVGARRTTRRPATTARYRTWCSAEPGGHAGSGDHLADVSGGVCELSGVCPAEAAVGIEWLRKG